MKRRRILISMAACMTLTALSATGADADPGDAHWYVGGSAGQGRADDTDNGIDLDDSAVVFRVYGGFDFNQYFGIEAQYIRFGEFEGTAQVNGATATITADATGFGLATVGRLPVSETFALIGRLGYLAWDADLTAAGLTDSQNDNDLYFGLGAEWAATDSVLVGADLERYSLDGTDVDVFTVGARLRF